MFDMTAAVPLALPVVVETGPQVGCYSDLLLYGRDMDDTDVNRDLATMPLSWHVVVDTETQVDVRWETTSAVVPFGDGCGHPAGWLDSEDVCDVPNEFPVGIEVAAVEPSCFPVVVQTRPQVGCDPALPLPVYKGQESLMEDGPDDIVSGSPSLNTQMSVGRSVWYRIRVRWLCLSWLRCR